MFDSAERPYRRIACEEGVTTRALLDANASVDAGGVPLLTLDGPARRLATRLIDHEARLAAMDEDGVDMQLLMVSAPGVQVFDAVTATQLARDVNDELAELCASHPDRFAALAAVAPHDPRGAPDEIARAVGKLGLRGVVVNSHTHGLYLDDPLFIPFLEALEDAGVPLYIHPRESPAPMRPYFEGAATEGAAWEYAVEAGTHFLRMVGAGVFDRHPRLRVVLGHMGEGLPFWIPRIDNRFLASLRDARRCERLPSEYVRDHLVVTTSGMNYREPLALALDVLGQDGVLFAADYPFENQGDAVDGVEQMGLPDDVKRALFESNAVRVFNL